MADGAAAGADRLPGPAATGPRDHARAGAARRRRALPVRRWPPARSRPFSAQAAAAGALPALAASGAPAMALVLGAVRGTVICCALRATARCAASPWVVVGMVLAALVASGLGAWAWRLGSTRRGAAVLGHLRHARLVHLAGLAAGAVDAVALARHGCRAVTSPFRSAVLLVGLVAMHADGRLRPRTDAGLPPWPCSPPSPCPPCSAAPRRPSTGSRCSSSSIAALTIWVVYVAMQTGIPAQAGGQHRPPGAGLRPRASPACRCASPRSGTVAWLWLVHWRAGRNRHPLWKSLVLPAGGVALCWLLLMTLLAAACWTTRAAIAPWCERIARHVPRRRLHGRAGLPRAQVVALEYFGGYRVDAVSRQLRHAAAPSCCWSETPGADAAPRRSGWMFMATRAAPHQRRGRSRRSTAGAGRLGCRARRR